MKPPESTYGQHFCEVDRGGMTLALRWQYPGGLTKSLIWMVSATGIEPIFNPKSHPADLPKTVLLSQQFLRYTFEIVYFCRANHLLI